MAARFLNSWGLAVVYIQDFQVAYEGYTGLAVHETRTPLNAKQRSPHRLSKQVAHGHGPHAGV